MFIIAEVGQAHEGSLGIAHSYIDALAETGVNAVKFQTHIANAESSIHEPFRVNFSYEDKTRFDYWKRMEFSKDQWGGLKKHCEDKEMEFLSSPFSCAAVDLLEEIGVKRYKIGSGEVNNLLLIKKIIDTGKPIILSSGMSSFIELDRAVNFIKLHSIDLTILQCTSAYPVSAESIGLNVLQEFKKRYEVPIGLSDHSGNIYASLAATSLGADVLEFHVVFDKRLFGPDSKASLTIEETKSLVNGAMFIQTALNSKVDKNNLVKFKSVKKIFEKSLSVNRNVKKGEILTEKILETKKPKGLGIEASEYEKILGKRFKHDLEQWSFITKIDIE